MTPVAVLCLLAVLGGAAVAVATDSISSLKCTEYATLADRHQCAAQYKAPHIEGKTATLPGEFPHMAHVGYTSEGGEEELLCGGSLISPHFVLTSAVCVTSRQPKFVVLGKGGSSPQRIRVAEGVAHPDFNRTVSYNDIALLRLAEAAALSDKVRPACLHRGPPLSTGDMTVATGWGATELGGDLSESLQKVALAVVDHAECNRMYSDSRKQLPRGIVSDIQICAGGGRSDTCQGDSGGPLQVLVKSPHCTYQIVGITSFGRACMSGPPGVYTRVAPFVSWIEKTVWP